MGIECGACGHLETVTGFYHNEQKGIAIKLCVVCVRTSELNGFYLVERHKHTT
jgi:hypothetical protein